MRWNALSLGSVLTLVACGGSGAETDENTTRGDSVSTADEGDDTGSTDDSASLDDTGVTGEDTRSTTGDTTLTMPEDGSGTMTDAPATSALRFVAVGDTGKGNDGQQKVADAIAAKCAKDGCDFVQLLGDNIYDSGVTSTSDPQWSTKFETPYGGISLPFYAVLGNHDYGGTFGGGTGNEFDKGQHQVDYTAKSTKWKMPAAHWGRTSKGVDMFGLDTNLVMWNRDVDKQKTSFNGWRAAAKGDWKIAFGHHPYLSNGQHGNAGSYEGFPLVPILSGANVKTFFDSTVCGNVDFYICGHDHSRQWLSTTCKGTELVVVGAGAATTALKGSNAKYWQESSLGFLYVVIDGKKLTGEMIDLDGKVQYTRTVTK